MKNACKRIDISGQKFTRLLAVKDVGALRKRRLWQCVCDCGSVVTVISSHLRNGNTRSCGCLRVETTIAQAERNAKHGLCDTGVYNSWNAMIHRCYDPKEASFKNYGKRGIQVCEYLRVTPANLKFVLGDRPAKLSLNRIKNDLGYSCGRCAECLQKGWKLNVEWATRTEQNRNTRQNVYITIGETTRCAAEWSIISGIPVGTILWRYRKGWLPHRLLIIGQCWQKP